MDYNHAWYDGDYNRVVPLFDCDFHVGLNLIESGIQDNLF